MIAAWLALATTLVAPSIGEVDLRVASDGAQPGQVAVRVCLPERGRWGELAPVVVVVPGGWTGSSLSRTLAPVAAHGCVEVRFCFTGEGDGQAQSGGDRDQRGAASTRALAEVIAFASGLKSAVDGRSLAQIARPVVPLGRQVGLLALDNGGNSAILALARWAERCANVAWLATWETPIGDAAAMGLLGDRDQGPNPAYDVRTGLWDPSTLAWNARGFFYQDQDRNGRTSPDDYPVDALSLPQEDGSVRLAYPRVVLAAAGQRRLCGEPWPSTLLSPAEADAFWAERNAATAFGDAVAARPALLAMVLGSAVDHRQVAADHPHLWAAYDGWRRAGLGWVRLNPDRAYLTALAGADLATQPETPANAALTRETLPAQLLNAPQLPTALLLCAGALELADRAHADRREPDLEGVLP